MPPADRLTAIQYGILRTVLYAHADRIDRVDLYGSRARGTHRPGSDVDLLIYGPMTSSELGRLAGDLEDSQLSLMVDVKLASRLFEGRFRDIVTAEAMTLFTRAELLEAAGG